MGVSTTILYPLVFHSNHAWSLSKKPKIITEVVVLTINLSTEYFGRLVDLGSWNMQLDKVGTSPTVVYIYIPTVTPTHDYRQINQYFDIVSTYLNTCKWWNIDLDTYYFPRYTKRRSEGHEVTRVWHAQDITISSCRDKEVDKFEYLYYEHIYITFHCCVVSCRSGHSFNKCYDTEWR